MRFKIGVDIGGTFTDTTVLREDGRVTIYKTPSTPDAPELGVLKGVITGMERAGVSPEDCDSLINSSTVGVNAIVQRRGATIGFLVTKGFEDLLEIGRAKMSKLFQLDAMPHAPLVRKNWVRGVTERINASGAVLTPLDRKELLAAARALFEQGARSMAVLFLHAHRNAAHELEAKEILAKEFPDITIAVSSEVWPQIREYERATVLVMNSYIAPKVSTYIRGLDAKKKDVGLKCPLYISGSNGGVMPAAHATERPITTLLSGPSAGVVATIQLMRDAKIDRAITLDIGGTSADICVLKRPDIPYAWGQEIEGLPVAVPYVDVSSIGAGGGSLAYADNMGLLRVGPDSAGAVPGPAAYDRGGTQPTLTDAYLLSGFVDPNNFVGGDIRLNPGKSEAAIRPLAEALKLDIHATAAGVIRVTNSNLVAEFTRLAAKNGIDQREFVLIPFGGAGPTQACLLADEMQIRRIAIPTSPGTFCALGSVLADFRLDYLKTVYSHLSAVAEPEVQAWYESVEARARATLAEAKSQIAEIKLVRMADVRYLGQGHEVAIEFDHLEGIPARFREEYRQLYGPRQDDSPIEVINFRATVVGLKKSPSLRWAPFNQAKTGAKERRVFIGKAWRNFPVYRREELVPGWKATGPFLVDQPDTTSVVTEGWTAELDSWGTIQLAKGHGR